MSLGKREYYQIVGGGRGLVFQKCLCSIQEYGVFVSILKNFSIFLGEEEKGIIRSVSRMFKVCLDCTIMCWIFYEKCGIGTKLLI